MQATSNLDEQRRAEFLAIVAHARERRQRLEQLATAPVPCEFVGTNGVRALVTPCLAQSGMWRVTWIQADGQPSGHLQELTYIDALREAMPHRVERSNEPT